MKKFKYLFFPLLVFVLLQLVFTTDFWNNLENRFSDNFFTVRHEFMPKSITKDVVIVAIDDESFSSLNTNWPFPREYYIKLIENLEKAGAKEIVFDILFTESSKPSIDSTLAVIGTKFDNVYFAGKIIDSENISYTRREILRPIKEITDRTQFWGVVNVPQDKDGFVRRYSVKLEFNKETHLSIGSWAAKPEGITKLNWKNSIITKSSKIYLGDHEIPLSKGKKVRLNYYGPAGTFPTYSFSSVIDDSTITTVGMDLNSFYSYLNDGVFKDKVVLVGATVEELRDMFYTPFFDGKGMMPGVEIHANFVEMFFQKDFLTDFSPVLFLFFSFLSTFLIYYLFLFIKPRLSLLLTVISIIISLYTAYYLFANQNIYIPSLEIPSILAILYIATLIHHYVKTAEERKFIKSAFSQYLAPELVDELIKDPSKIKFGGKEEEITVLFSDIRNFTPYAESHSAQETVAVLKDFFTEMVKIVIKNGGIVDKFVGDEMMAMFGMPVKYKDHAFRACKTALEMRERFEELKKEFRQQKRDDFEIGIGLNSGNAIVGNVGSEQIFDYSAIGDTVNLGARLEAINKNYDTENKIIFSQYTYEMVKDKVIAKFLDKAKVKGKSYPIDIYELIGIKPQKEKPNYE